jgi:uroporphyrinogen decarboxylase
MNERQRFVETLTFGNPDKIPMQTMGPRESTIAAWRSQGMPAGESWFRALCREIGVDYDFPKQPAISPDIDFRMIPQFEEKTLAHQNGHYILQDWMGNVIEISDSYDASYIRSAKDFVTRRWIKFPVENREDFEEMKKRYDPDAPERFPEDFKTRAAALSNRDYPLTIQVNGPFWQMREWCGFEPLCMLFIEDPAFIEEMTEFWKNYISKMLNRILAELVPDRLHMSEDMAYKGASMISPVMAEQHLKPAWKTWSKLAVDAGVPVIDMDSDGNIDELIPLWINAGINCCDPIEAAAGCDITEYRERFGKSMAFTGGIDKRAIAAGGKIIEAEVDRIAPVCESGGYIPGCDHGIPADVTWQNMVHFGKLWADLTGWR